MIDRIISFLQQHYQHQYFFPDFGFEGSYHSSPSVFTFGPVESTNVTRVVGLCVMFKYKMSNSRETELSLSTSTASGTQYKIWKLSGIHGEKWNTAWVHLSVNETIKVCWSPFILNYNLQLQSVYQKNTVPRCIMGCSCTFHI